MIRESIEFAVPPLAAAGLILFGQQNADAWDVKSLLSQGGGYGILAWHLWHTTTKTIPGMLDKFDRQLEAQRQHDANENEKNRIALAEQLQKQRDHDATESSLTRQANHTIANHLQGMACRVDHGKDA